MGTRWMRLLAVLAALVLVAVACGDSDDDSGTSDTTEAGTTGDAATTAAADDGTTTTAAVAGTTEAGGEATGEPAGTIKIGYVTPRTGLLAEFGKADSFVLDQMREQFADGLQVGDATYEVEIIDRDSESSSQTAANAAQELILDDEVDLILVSSTPDTTIPVAQQCANNEIPCISTMAPWQPHYLGLGGLLPPEEDPPPAASEWNYHFFWGLEDIINVYLNIWNEGAPGGTVGALWPDDPDGNAWSDPVVGFPPAIEAAGFTLVDPGRFPLETNDFTAQINAFKDAGVTIVSGVLPPPVFSTFWTQAQQQGFTPEIVTVGKGLLFPGAVASFDQPNGLTTEVWWTPEHPFTSSLTGQTAADLGAAFEEAAGEQWTQPIGFAHALFEVAADALARSADPNDPAALIEAIGATSMDTVVGAVDFSVGPVGGITKTSVVGGQWVTGGDDPVDLVIVENANLPEVPTGASLALL